VFGGVLNVYKDQPNCRRHKFLAFSTKLQIFTFNLRIARAR